MPELAPPVPGSALPMDGPSADPARTKITIRLPMAAPVPNALPSPQIPIAPAPEATQEEGGPPGKRKKARTVDWSRDGVGGRPSSLELLLDWLAAPNNIDRWRNGYGGIKQKAACQLCSDWLAANDCPTPRDSDACNFKIRSLFESWKKAQDYKHTTGHGKGLTILWQAEQTGMQDKMDAAVRMVERSVKSLCPLWDQLDPIFAERDGGCATLRADTTSTFNPPVETLAAALRESQGTQAADDQHSDLGWGPSDREDAGEGQDPSVAGGDAVTVSSRRGSVRSVATVSSATSISDRNQRKRSRWAGDLDIGSDLFRQDTEYRSSKLAKLDEANAIQARKVRADVGKAVIEAAKILKDLSPSRSWDDCKTEARKELCLDE